MYRRLHFSVLALLGTGAGTAGALLTPLAALAGGAALLCGACWCASRWRRRDSGRGARETWQEDLLRCPTDELCARWRSSSTSVRAARSSFERDRLSRLRRRYLDELERRDPRGFALWMLADPLVDDPGGYLHADH